MFVNQIKINISESTSSASTINIPISMEYQLVDQSELVDRVFVKEETNKAINGIVDFEKTRFFPIDSNDIPIDKMVFILDLSGATNYGDIGFSNEDIKFKRETFKQTFLNLNFYDSYNPFSQNLVTNITLYSQLTESDLIPLNSNTGIPGQPKDVFQIPLMYVLENPLNNPRGFAEGFFIYDYKDELNFNETKYLYMKASFKNAKDGKTTNLMVKDMALPIDELVHELYTRYKLVRYTNGYFFMLDDSYQGNSNQIGPNNVSYNGNSVIISLYQIRAL